MIEGRMAMAMGIGRLTHGHLANNLQNTKAMPEGTKATTMGHLEND